MMKELIKSEGLSPEEILDLPGEQLDELVFTGKLVVLRVGTAEVLGAFLARTKHLTSNWLRLMAVVKES